MAEKRTAEQRTALAPSDEQASVPAEAPASEAPIAPTTKTIGVLDTNMRLVGSKVAPFDAEGPVDPGDLRLDGSYKWDPESRAYHPLGHNFGKVKTRQPFETDLVLAKMIEVMGDAAPFEAKEWLGWYNVELRRRHEELAARPR